MLPMESKPYWFIFFFIGDFKRLAACTDCNSRLSVPRCSSWRTAQCSYPACHFSPWRGRGGKSSSRASPGLGASQARSPPPLPAAQGPGLLLPSRGHLTVPRQATKWNPPHALLGTRSLLMLQRHMQVGAHWSLQCPLSLLWNTECTRSMVQLLLRKKNILFPVNSKE